VSCHWLQHRHSHGWGWVTLIIGYTVGLCKPDPPDAGPVPTQPTMYHRYQSDLNRIVIWNSGTSLLAWSFCRVTIIWLILAVYARHRRLCSSDFRPCLLAVIRFDEDIGCYLCRQLRYGRIPWIRVQLLTLFRLQSIRRLGLRQFFAGRCFSFLVCFNSLLCTYMWNSIFNAFFLGNFFTTIMLNLDSLQVVFKQ